MTEKQLDIYLDNIEKISKLLLENEEILKEAGYCPPVNNFAVEKDKRIRFPAGYIRTSNEFETRYHLSQLVSSKNVRKNISYALQLSDYYNFLINRFYIWGSIETMLIKQAFINLISIIEALILECANKLNKYCQSCHKIGICSNNLNKYDRANMKNAVDRLVEIGILDLSNNQKDRLVELYDLRNKIHIRLSEQNEFLDQKFKRELYNETIELLQLIDDKLYNNAVRYYSSCIGFAKKDNDINL